MHDEQAFLARIRETPDDVAPRLVYADWLDEHDDPRGELIRVTEEMRTLAPYSDAYWTLKPRRKALREGVAEEWLEAMRYNDVWPIFTHGWPDGWRDRWRLIREFYERWHRESLPDVGGQAAAIATIEERLQRRLPPSMREWVAFAYDYRGETNHQDAFQVIRDVYRMQPISNRDAIVLLEIAEGNVLWGVRHEDFMLDDPPVYTYFRDDERWNEGDFVQGEAKRDAETLSDFVWSYVLGYTHAEGGGFGTHVTFSDGLLTNLAEAFPIHNLKGNTRYYEKDNIMVRLHHWDNLRESERYLAVELAKPLTKERIPAFLWAYTQGGGSFHGMFADQERFTQPTPSNAEQDDGIDIPF